MSQPTSNQQTESGIPVLTEVLKVPVYGVDLPERRVASNPPAAVPIESLLGTTAATPTVTPTVTQSSVAVMPADPSPVQPAPAFDAARAEELATEITQRVLQQILGQVDSILEQRLRDTLADVLQTAVDGLACQLRHGLKDTLKEVLAQAVSTELENRGPLKK